MKDRPKSGHFYPNRLVLATFNALIDMMGRNGLNTILTFAQLREYINQYPPDNLEKEFDFADFTAVKAAIIEMYGEQGGNIFIKRAARSTFKEVLSYHGAMAGVSSEAFQALPMPTRLRIGLLAMARIFSQVSDQTTSIEDEVGTFRYIVHQCPECWGRNDIEKCVCTYGAGMLEEGLKWISGGSEFLVTEIKCIAKGDDACEYSIEKSPIST